MTAPSRNEYTTIDVPVRGGLLRTAAWGSPDAGAPTVLAVHGVTSSHMQWAVLVLGHSMGAFVAEVFAHLHPDRVSSLVLVDGGLPLPAESPGLYTQEIVETHLHGQPSMRAELVPGVNHYTIVMGGAGAARLAAVVKDMLAQEDLKAR